MLNIGHKLAIYETVHCHMNWWMSTGSEVSVAHKANHTRQAHESVFEAMILMDAGGMRKALPSHDERRLSSPATRGGHAWN